MVKNYCNLNLSESEDKLSDGIDLRVSRQKQLKKLFSISACVWTLDRL